MSTKFLSTLSLRRATRYRAGIGCRLLLFLSTLSLRRATLLYAMGYYRCRNFYPRSPCGERRSASRTPTQAKKFLSTLSLRRATAIDVFLAVWAIISIHALLAESDPLSDALACTVEISIHALLAESDAGQVVEHRDPAHFYPRSPCGERRKPRRLKSRRCVFLSTLSLRRATAIVDNIVFVPGFLSTLSLRRAT